MTKAKNNAQEFTAPNVNHRVYSKELKDHIDKEVEKLQIRLVQPEEFRRNTTRDTMDVVKIEGDDN